MMKRRMKGLIGILALLMMLVMPISIEANENINITITQPSPKETTIAKDRSFYIKGAFTNVETLPADSYLQLQIKSNGQVVRSMNSFAKKDIHLKVVEGLPLFYSGVTKEMVAQSGMPDLVWDGVNDESFTNGNTKCYFDDNGFNALVYVPNDSVEDELHFTDNGNAFSALAEGDYQLDVQLFSGNHQVLAKTTQDITIGVSPNKILARFSPDEHLAHVKAFAASKGYRVYDDAFPGYWSQGDVFAEILSTWRGADIAEYKEGLVHFIIYNVKKTSTTYGVELAQLQRMQDIDDPKRLVNYYYEYGEPSLPNQLQSDIVAFEKQDKLVLTRAELSNEAARDNVYDKNSIADELVYDTNLADGVNVQDRQTLSLYGVCAPIQVAQSDIIDAGKNASQLNNKLATVKYVMSAEGVNIQFEKEVLLNRKDGDWNHFSEMEFKHDIPITKAMQNKKLNVEIVGFDAHGEKVVGSEERFTIDTTKPMIPNKPGVETSDTTSLTFSFNLIMISGIVIYMKIRKEA